MSRLPDRKLDAYVEQARARGEHIELVCVPTRDSILHRDTYTVRLAVVDRRSTVKSYLPTSYTLASERKQCSEGISHS